MIRVYVAGSWIGRQRIAKEIKTLPANFKVLGNWFDETFFLERQWDWKFGGAVAKAMAQIDMYHVMAADLVIVDSITQSSTGGSDTELGAAIALAVLRRCTVVHIGLHRNIFHSLADEHYETWDAFREHLGRTLAYDV